MRDNSSPLFEPRKELDQDFLDALDWCAARSPKQVMEEREAAIRKIEQIGQEMLDKDNNMNW